MLLCYKCLAQLIVLKNDHFIAHPTYIVWVLYTCDNDILECTFILLNRMNKIELVLFHYSFFSRPWLTLVAAAEELLNYTLYMC